MLTVKTREIAEVILAKHPTIGLSPLEAYLTRTSETGAEALVRRARTTEIIATAVAGILRWMANEVVRSRSYRPRPFRSICPPSLDTLTTLYGQYGGDYPDIFRIVSEFMFKEMTHFPLVGTIKDGMLIPNKEELRAWRSHADHTNV